MPKRGAIALTLTIAALVLLLNFKTPTQDPATALGAGDTTPAIIAPAPTDSSASSQVGTRVFVEGPYGILTAARRSKRGVLMVAGGVGITPLRALFEDLPVAGQDLTIIYRARSERELVFRAELDTLASIRGGTVHYLLGRRPRHGQHDPLGPAAILAAAPDVAERDVYLCGPTSMMEGVHDALRRLSVPDSQIHWERFAY